MRLVDLVASCIIVGQSWPEVVAFPYFGQAQSLTSSLCETLPSSIDLDFIRSCQKITKTDPTRSLNSWSRASCWRLMDVIRISTSLQISRLGLTAHKVGIVESFVDRSLTVRSGSGRRPRPGSIQRLRMRLIRIGYVWRSRRADPC